MLTPLVQPLFADRWTPFAETFVFTGLDLTGATIAVQIRLYRDAPGSAIKTLGMAATSTADGLWLASVEYVGGQPVSTVTMRIADVTIMPAAAEPGNDAVFKWGLNVTMPFDDEMRLIVGDFTLRAGEVQ